MDFKRCSESSSNKDIPVKENGMIFRILNPQQRKVCKLKVDGCLIQNSDKRIRCDYMFEIGDPRSLVCYVELKGNDINKAYEQLEASLGYFKDRHSKCTKECYIVASRVPRATAHTQILKLNFLKKNKCQLFIGTKEFKKSI